MQPGAITKEDNKMSNISFRTKLTSVINECSMENGSNTPDFILSQYLASCLKIFDEAIQQRETWYFRNARPSETKEDNPCQPNA
jgi:hypothetical protein